MIKVNYDREEFIDKLLDKGYEEIGSGFFSTVYGHPKKNTVLKVFYQDKGYMNFCKAIINMKNPYFPEIKSIKQYKLSEDDGMFVETWFVVELEKLIPFKWESKIQTKVISKHKIHLGSRNLKKNEFGNFEHFVRAVNVKKLKNKKLARAINVMRKAKDYHSLDLHEDNIMFRKEKTGYQLVFTDPIAECMR